MEVYSRSMAKWMRGIVLEVEEDALKVSYGDDKAAGEKYVDPDDSEQVRPYVPPEGAAVYSVGDPVSVYSRSLQKWVDGEVLGMLPNGDVDVTYGDTSNQGRKCIDPNDASSLQPRKLSASGALRLTKRSTVRRTQFCPPLCAQNG